MCSTARSTGQTAPQSIARGEQGDRQVSEPGKKSGLAQQRTDSQARIEGAPIDGAIIRRQVL